MLRRKPRKTTIRPGAACALQKIASDLASENRVAFARVCRTAARRDGAGRHAPGSTQPCEVQPSELAGSAIRATRGVKSPPSRKAQAVSIAAFGTIGISTPQCELGHIR